jgi:four helix bundle protein
MLKSIKLHLFPTANLFSMKENLIMAKSLDFSIKIVQYCELLQGKKHFIIANQLLKSATSIGANVYEAQDAESKLDFIHKIKIASKEATETFFWLTICEKLKQFDIPPEVLNELKSIRSILGKIISTSKKKIN